MRLGIALIVFLAFAFCAAPSQAQFGSISIATEWVEDFNVGGGGYVRTEVVNNGSEAVYVVAIGDNSDINVVYTAPEVAGQWGGRVVVKGDWQNNEADFIEYSWFTPPDTSVDPYIWDHHFPTNWHCVTWQARQEPYGIQPGDTTPTEFRYLLGEGAKRAVYGPLNYMVMGENGEILGSGTTSITGVVPTEGASFGQVKALFTR